ncbi:MAG: hypothetical protein JWP04_3514 [Belnapia sp.]|nr:hypothetical protein [Belnapia sp.]
MPDVGEGQEQPGVATCPMTAPLEVTTTAAVSLSASIGHGSYGCKAAATEAGRKRNVIFRRRQGHIAALRVQAQRFRCTAHGCQRLILIKRLPEVGVPRGRQTRRPADIQRHIGLVLWRRSRITPDHRLTTWVGVVTLLDMLRRGASETPAQAP